MTMHYKLEIKPKYILLYYIDYVLGSERRYIKEWKWKDLKKHTSNNIVNTFLLINNTIAEITVHYIEREFESSDWYSNTRRAVFLLDRLKELNAFKEVEDAVIEGDYCHINLVSSHQLHNYLLMENL